MPLALTQDLWHQRPGMIASAVQSFKSKMGSPDAGATPPGLLCLPPMSATQPPSVPSRSSSVDEKRVSAASYAHAPSSEGHKHAEPLSESATLASPEHLADDDNAHNEELEISGVKEPFDWETDPENPRNWTFRRKWITITIVSLYTM